MKPSPSVPFNMAAWYRDMEPGQRPVQPPLPTLEYESDLKVWQWRVKLVLKHNSLLCFVLMSAPQPPYKSSEEDAAATHCAALLSSCISEIILGDILTLAPEGDFLEDPRVIFVRTERIFKAVRMVRKDGSIFLRDILSGEKRPQSLDMVCNALSALPRKGDTLNSWRNIILIAVLLIKRYDLAELTGATKDIIKRAHDESEYLSEDDFKKMMAGLTVPRVKKEG